MGWDGYSVAGQDIRGVGGIVKQWRPDQIGKCGSNTWRKILAGADSPADGSSRYEVAVVT